MKVTQAFCCAALVLAPALALAQYPDHPVKIIVPSGPGGGYDVLARQVAPRLGELLHQSVIVENRAGAGTVVGTQAAASAAPDGYTLVIGGPSNIAFNAGLYKKLPYDPSDFVTVSLIVNYPYMLMVRRDLPQASLKELVAAARAAPGKLSLGTAGVGTGHHIVAASFLKATGTDLVLVHYKGAQQAYPDLLSGRIDVLFDTVTSARPFVEAGKVKALAMASAQRSPSLPQLPLAREQGFPGFELDSWTGLFAPSKVPAPVLERLRTEVERVKKSPEFRTQMETGGGQLMDLSPRESEAFVRAEVARWVPLIRGAGISAD